MGHRSELWRSHGNRRGSAHHGRRPHFLAALAKIVAHDLRARSALYLLDEPTVELHFADVQRLLEVLDDLIERGDTVVVVEHNLDVIRNADWVVDLGPEGGEGGGRLMAEGPLEAIAACAESWTGRFLRRGATWEA